MLCRECGGEGTVGRQVDVDAWLEWPCEACGGSGDEERECEHGCGRSAPVLVEDGVPACRECAEDYVQGPVRLEEAPWQTE